MEKPAVTLDQAKAFVEAVCGWVTLGVVGNRDGCLEEARTPTSPAARTHLEAVLGFGRLPSVYDVCRAQEFREKGARYYEFNATMVDRFADYLIAVGRVLKGEGDRS